MTGKQTQPPMDYRPVPSFFARLVEMLAVTDQFVVWWGAHRAWPANERPEIDGRR